jgi:hydroxypyruvate reductase
MNKELRKDAEVIAFRAIEAVKPDAAVARALHNVQLTGNIYLVSVGKAAWQMAAAAVKNLKVPVCKGIVVTKYDHVMG